MLDYIKRITKPCRLKGFPCSPPIFRPVVGGVIHSFNYDVDASSFEDYSADKLISSGVDMEKSQSFDDVSLDALDGVEEMSMRILESENLTIKTEKS